MPAPIKLMLDVNATKGSITAGINSIVRGLTPPPVKLKVELDSDKAISQLNALTSQERHIRVGVDLGQGTNGLQDLENRLNRIQEATKNTAKNMRGQVKVDNLTGSFDRFEVRVDRMRTAVANLQKGFDNGIRSQSGEDLSRNLKNIINDYDELRSRLKAHNDGIEILDADELADVQNRFRNLQIDASRFSSEINKLGDAASFDRLRTNITNLTSKVENMRDAWSAMFTNKDFAQRHETLLNDLQTGTMTAQDYAARVLEFSKLSRDVQKQGLDHISVFGRLQKAFANFGAFFTASRVFYKGVEEIRKMVSAVTELDTAMVELRKVSDASDTQLSRFFEGTKTSAVELGTTMHDLINATADYSRLGYSLPEAENLAKVATVYKTVGDDVDTIDQATTSLISTMKGFGIETKDASSIVDKFNEVGNRFAISSGGIGEALQRSAASFKAANNTIDESIALVVAANNVIQDPDVVGTMWKTVTMRIRGAKTELEDAGLETDNMAESPSKLREQIKALTNVDGTGGFDIMADANNFKSTYDIVLGIGQVWQQMADVDQAALLELLAGKRQGNALAAALNNLDDLQKALEVSETSAGSAEREHERWMDSIEAKTAQFKASFEALSSDLIGSDLIKGVVDFGTGFVQSIDMVVSAIGKLGLVTPALLSFFAAFTSQEVINEIPQVLSRISDFVFGGNGKNGLWIGDAINTVRRQFTDLRDSIHSSLEGVTGFTDTLRGAGNGLRSWWSGLSGVTKVFTGLTVGLTAAAAAYELYQWHKQKVEERRSNAEESAREYQDRAKSLQSYAKEVKSLRAIADSDASSTQAQVEAKQRLAAIEQELVGLYGSEASGINLVTGAINEQVAAIEKLNKDQWNNWQQENKKAISESNKQMLEYNDSILRSASNTGFSHFDLPDLWGTPIGGKSPEFLKELRKELEKIDGISVPDVLAEGITIDSDNIYEARDALSELYDAVEQAGRTTLGGEGDQYLSGYLGGLSERITSLDKIIAENETNFNTYAEGVLSYSSTYSDAWRNMKNAQDEYEAAVLSGDDSRISKAIEGLKAAKAGLDDLDINDENVSLYIDRMYKSLEDDFQNKELELNLKAKLTGDIDDKGLRDNISNALKSFTNENGEVDLALIGSARIDAEHGVTGRVVNDFKTLQTAAHDYGMEVEDVVGVMEQLGQVKIAEGSDIDRVQQYTDAVQRYKDEVKRARDAGTDLNKTVYGNIDAANRNILTWDSKTIEKNQAAIESWGETVESLGDFSTIMGQSAQFGEFPVEVAFSPILQTPDGGKLLEKGTVYDYITKIIDQATDTETGTVDISKALALDARGIKIEGETIKGLIADIGETAIATGEQMHFVGPLGGVASEYKEILSMSEEVGLSADDFIKTYDRWEIAANSASKAVSNLWKDEQGTFKETKEQLIALANSTEGITPGSIRALATEGSDLAKILEMDGMSAELLASSLQSLATGGDLSGLTADALQLSDAIGGLAQKYNEAAQARNEFQERRDKTRKEKDIFEGYQSDYKSAMELVNSGVTGGIEYESYAEQFLGSDRLKELGYDPKLINAELKAQAGLWDANKKAGVGFLDAMYSRLDENKQILGENGEVLAEFKQNADGSFDWNVDNADESLDQLAKKLGTTKEALLGALNAQELWGSANLDVNDTISAMQDLGKASKDASNNVVMNMDALEEAVDPWEFEATKNALEKFGNVSFLGTEQSAEELQATLAKVGQVGADGMVQVNDSLFELMSSIGMSSEQGSQMLQTLAEAGMLDFSGSISSLESLIQLWQEFNGLGTPSMSDKDLFEGIGTPQSSESEVNVKYTQSGDKEIKETNKEIKEVEGTHNSNVNISTKGTKEAENSKKIIDSIPEKKKSILTAIDKAKKTADGVKTAVKNIPPKHNTNLTATDNATSIIQKVNNAIANVTRSITVWIYAKFGGLFGGGGGDWTGTTHATEGPTLVGERGEELVQSGNKAYFVGTHHPEIVWLKQGDVVYNAEETKKIKGGQSIPNKKNTMQALASGGYVPGGSGGSSGSNTKSSGSSSNKTTNRSKTSTASVEIETVTSYADKKLEEQLKDTLDQMEETIDHIIGDYEHQIFLMEEVNDDPKKIIEVYKKMQKAVGDQANEYRKKGLSDNSDYIQDLQKQWWEYADKIKDIITEQYEETRKLTENAIDLNTNWLNDAIAKKSYEGVLQYSQNIVQNYKYMQEQIHDQAEYYRSLGYTDTSDEVSELSKLWYEYRDKIIEATTQAYAEMVDTAGEAVDNIQSLYSTLLQAGEEYADSRHITIDTFQELVGLGTKYLAFLYDENGMLVINEESIKRVLAAKTKELAINEALNYVAQIRSAVETGNLAQIDALCDATGDLTNATWGLVYAQLSELNISDEQYRSALININRLRALSEEAINNIDHELNQMKGDVGDILEYVKEMVKQEVENHIEALEEQVKHYNEIVDLQKESLKLEKDRDEYSKKIAKQTKSIAELQAKIEQLRLDNSREATAQRLKLEEELAEKQEALADDQSDHAYDATTNALDKMAEAYEKEKNEEIKILQNTISSEEKIYQMAIARIDKGWDNLYDDLIKWNTEYGSHLNMDITDAWEEALKMAQKYGDYLTYLNVQRETDKNGNTTYTNGAEGRKDIVGTSVTDNAIRQRTTEMLKNSEQWLAYEKIDKSYGWKAHATQQQELADRNAVLAAELEELIGEKLVRGTDGVWYLGKVGGRKLYSVYPAYTQYHSGGIVGDRRLFDDEEYALLQKGEVVLTPTQQANLYRRLDAFETMYDKFGKFFSLTGTMPMNTALYSPEDISTMRGAMMDNSVNTLATTVNVSIHGAVDDAAMAKRYGEQIGNETIRTINDAFYKRGINRSGNVLLKQ